jgi:hypothetical protein
MYIPPYLVCTYHASHPERQNCKEKPSLHRTAQYSEIGAILVGLILLVHRQHTMLRRERSGRRIESGNFLMLGRLNARPCPSSRAPRRRQ